MGRAALQLDHPVVFGKLARDGAMRGFVARPGRWEPVDYTPVDAVFDRYPNRGIPEEHARLRAALQPALFANSWAATLVCRDKVRTQQLLAPTVPMPAIETDPSRFAARLEQWGAAFVKPRYGCSGRGVARVVPGDAVPTAVDGAVEGELEAAFLQQAVPPLPGWSGVSVRVNAQRDPGADTWSQNPVVVRRSETDWVVNAGRGAEVRAGIDVLSEATLEQLELTVDAVCAAFTDPLLIEIGVDAMIDVEGRPIVLEVNSRPTGRGEVLAEQDPERFAALHVAACKRPLERLLSLL